MKKDKLPKFASEAESPAQSITEPPTDFKDKGYQSDTSQDLIANYDNYNYQKAYNGIKFNRFLAIQKASQKVENSFDDGEIEYPFVYSGGIGIIDIPQKEINISKSFSYPKYDFNQDDQSDGLGEHFYPVEKEIDVISFLSADADTVYTSNKNTINDILVNSQYSGTTGSINFLFQGVSDVVKTVQISFVNFLVSNINCVANNGDLGTFDIFLNGVVSVNYIISTDNPRLYVFSSADLISVATITQESGFPGPPGAYVFQFIDGGGSLDDTTMNFNFNFLINKSNGMDPQGIVPVNNNDLFFQDINPTITDQSTNLDRQHWGVFMRSGFNPDGTENHQYILEKINTTNFDFEKSRSEILTYILNPTNPIKDVLFDVLIKQLENGSLVTYSLVNNPLGERKQRLSFGKSLPIGSILSFGGIKSQIPNNYLFCDGSEVLKADYPVLFSKLLDRWGVSGDLSMFVLPDLVDQFVRGVDEITRNVGSIELDAGRNVTGSYNIYGNNSVGEDWYFGETGAFGKGPSAERVNMTNTGVLATTTNGQTFDASRVWGAEHTSTEFRPQNKGVFYIIKAL